MQRTPKNQWTESWLPEGKKEKGKSINVATVNSFDTNKNFTAILIQVASKRSVISLKNLAQPTTNQM